MAPTCANCQTALPVNANYCLQCGQSTKSYQRPFGTFFKDAMHELLDIDGQLWLTIKTLLLKPGLASYEYGEGKRSKYTPPLRLYLVVSVVFFVIFSSFQHVYTRDISYSGSTTDLYSRAMFVLFPLFAFYIKCFYWKSYYLVNLVFSMHLHTVGYLALMIIGPLESLEESHVTFLYLQVLPTVYLLWYVFVAFKTMYCRTWPVTAVKTIAIYMVYMATFGIVFDAVLV